MYTLLELKEKTKKELIEIAKTMGIKGLTNKSMEDIILSILQSQIDLVQQTTMKKSEPEVKQTDKSENEVEKKNVSLRVKNTVISHPDVIGSVVLPVNDYYDLDSSSIDLDRI